MEATVQTMAKIAAVANPVINDTQYQYVPTLQAYVSTRAIFYLDHFTIREAEHLVPHNEDELWADQQQIMKLLDTVEYGMLLDLTTNLHARHLVLHIGHSHLLLIDTTTVAIRTVYWGEMYDYLVGSTALVEALTRFLEEVTKP